MTSRQEDQVGKKAKLDNEEKEVKDQKLTKKIQK